MIQQCRLVRMYNLTKLNSGSEAKKIEKLPQRIEPFAYSHTALEESISDFRPILCGVCP